MASVGVDKIGDLGNQRICSKSGQVTGLRTPTASEEAVDQQAATIFLAGTILSEPDPLILWLSD